MIGQKNAGDLEKQQIEFGSYHDGFLFKASQMANCLSKMRQIADLIKTQVTEIIKTSKVENKKNSACPIIEIPKSAIMGFDTAFTNEFLGYISPFLKDLIVLQNRFLYVLGIYMKIHDVPELFTGFFDKAGNPRPILDKFGDRVKYLSRAYWISIFKLIGPATVGVS